MKKLRQCQPMACLYIASSSYACIALAVTCACTLIKSMLGGAELNGIKLYLAQKSHVPRLSAPSSRLRFNNVVTVNEVCNATVQDRRTRQPISDLTGTQRSVGYRPTQSHYIAVMQTRWAGGLEWRAKGTHSFC